MAVMSQVYPPLAGIEVATLVGVIAALAAGYFVRDTRLVEK